MAQVRRIDLFEGYACFVKRSRRGKGRGAGSEGEGEGYLAMYGTGFVPGDAAAFACVAYRRVVEAKLGNNHARR